MKDEKMSDAIRELMMEMHNIAMKDLGYECIEDMVVMMASGAINDAGEAVNGAINKLMASEFPLTKASMNEEDAIPYIGKLLTVAMLAHIGHSLGHTFRDAKVPTAEIDGMIDDVLKEVFSEVKKGYRCTKHD